MEPVLHQTNYMRVNHVTLTSIFVLELTPSKLHRLTFWFRGANARERGKLSASSFQDHFVSTGNGFADFRSGSIATVLTVPVSPVSPSELTCCWPRDLARMGHFRTHAVQ